MTFARRSTIGPCLAAMLAAVWGSSACPTAQALVVEATGANVAPVGAADPGWNNFSITNGGRDYIYLGDGWALSAMHVGPTPAQVASSSFSETLQFFNGTETKSLGYIPNQVYFVPNPCYGTGGCITPNSQYTDLQLVRLNGDPGLPSLTIASQPVLASTPIEEREVTIIGRGRGRLNTLSYWNATQVAGEDPPNDTWILSTAGSYNQYGYRTFDSDTKRWGTNQIADETVLANEVDADLRMVVYYDLSVGRTDVVSMATIFDAPNPGVIPANETQAVNGDSGAAVFYKRAGQWELIGIVNGTQAPQVPGTNPAQFYDQLPAGGAVYGSQILFADLSYYHDAIENIRTSHANYSIAGDVNLDGVVAGNGTGGSASDDVSAFLTPYLEGYDNDLGVGNITSWKNGDLDRNGKTQAADYAILFEAMPLAGDYNDDEVVDALDYAVWRNKLGQAIALPNETATANMVDDQDFNVWKSSFGKYVPTLAELVNSGGGGVATEGPTGVGGSAGVPEPAAGLLAIVAACFALAQRRRR